jgi:hypothetical protein
MTPFTEIWAGFIYFMKTVCIIFGGTFIVAGWIMWFEWGYDTVATIHFSILVLAIFYMIGSSL